MAARPPARWEHASLWSQSLPATRSGAIDPDGRWDVIVVGGGLAGLTTATVLQRAGLRVLVLERHGIGGVTTRSSTGKLSALQGDMYLEISDACGQDAAASYAASALLGVAGLRHLIHELEIDCALTDAVDHTYATEEAAGERAQAVHDAAQRAGLPVGWAERSELPFPLTGAVRLDGQAHLDPGALCAGLAAALSPGTVVEGSPVLGIDEDDDGVTVHVESGATVRADHVVIATLAPIHDPALLATRCEARRSYAIAAPCEDPVVAMHLSVDEASRSIRPTTIDGRSGIVVGGGGHVVGELGGRSAEERWADLERFAVDVLGADAATHRWVTHDLVPSDHVPFIGRLAPGAERRWVISGFQKWGISTSYVAADLLLGELEGQPPAWAGLFDPRRIAASLTTKLVQDGVRAVRHLVVDRIDDLRHAGEDRPRCTHLGCVLDFDDGEQTWDCPCHGSRYDAEGNVICGPASTPLSL